MEPADIMKIGMSVDEAKEAFSALPEDNRLRMAPEQIATIILFNKPTPAQAQAALVLAWNHLLRNSALSFHPFDYPN